MKTAWVYVLTLAAMGSISGASQEASPVASGLVPIPDRVYVGLAAFATPIAGKTEESGGGSIALRAGDEGQAYIFTGNLDQSGRPVKDLCFSQTGSGRMDDEAASKAAHVWKARVNLLSATMESIVIGVDWSHDGVSDRGLRSRVAGDRRTVTLREGERHTLDYIASPGVSDGCAANLRVDLEAKIAEDPRFVGRRIQYDLWLIDETAQGVRETREFTATAEHGEKIAFSLDPLRWELPGVVFRSGQGAQALARVRGSIRGRFRDDGTVEVMFEANRNVGIAEEGKPLSGSVEDGGEKAVRIAPGETLGLVLPAASGAHTESLDQTWSSVVGSRGMTTAGISLPGPASGVEVDAQRVTVDFAKFLAGHKMSLRLTASSASS